MHQAVSYGLHNYALKIDAQKRALRFGAPALRMEFIRVESEGDVSAFSNRAMLEVELLQRYPALNELGQLFFAVS